jgi:hypothetical protein
MKKQIVLTITLGYATLFSIPLMAMHEDRAYLEPIDLNSLARTIDRWKTKQAQLAAVKTGLFAAGVGASYFYFRPEMRTIQNIMTCALAIFGITGLIYRLKKSYNQNHEVPLLLAAVHNNTLQTLSKHLEPLSLKILSNLPFGKPDVQSRANIYNVLFETYNDKSYSYIMYIINSLYTQRSNTAVRVFSDNTLNNICNRYDFFIPTAATIRANRDILNNLFAKIDQWCGQSSSEQKIVTLQHKLNSFEKQDALQADRPGLEILFKEMAKIEPTLIEECRGDIEYLVAYCSENITKYNTKVKEHNALCNQIEPDIKKVMRNKGIYIQPIEEISIELPKSIGKEEE